MTEIRGKSLYAKLMIIIMDWLDKQGMKWAQIGGPDK